MCVCFVWVDGWVDVCVCVCLLFMDVELTDWPFRSSSQVNRGALHPFVSEYLLEQYVFALPALSPLSLSPSLCIFSQLATFFWAAFFVSLLSLSRSNERMACRSAQMVLAPVLMANDVHYYGMEWVAGGLFCAESIPKPHRTRRRFPRE